MSSCDVVIVGGGPAGSSCARRLVAAGLDVVVYDRAVFPRDKVCAGWITPQVVAETGMDLDDYRQRRTLQPITGFRIGRIGDPADTDMAYDEPISYGIRRCEFDHYLLERSGAQLRLGEAVSSIERAPDGWVINGAVSAPIVVGAGGHFCPVSRAINTPQAEGPLVVAQEAEFELDPADEERYSTAGVRPELYFCRDLKGYGWSFRKGRHLNVGLGRLDRRSLPDAMTGFIAYLQQRRTLPASGGWRWRGHAYYLAQPVCRRAVDEGVLLIGDAAGLAYPQSGEGIRPAVESGLLAASAILEARGDYSRRRLAPYETALAARFRPGGASHAAARLLPHSAAASLFPRLLASPWLMRRLVLERWFLHAHEPALA